MKLKEANYESQWNILVFCGQWKMMSDLNMSHGKVSDLVLFSLFWFTLAIKLRNFDSESHWNTFDKKICPMKVISDFVSFPLFGFTLTKNLRNSDFGSH